MSNDTMMKAAVKTQVRVNGWANTTVERMTGREKSRGQTAVEYLGIIAVVALIIGALLGSDIGTTILNKLKAQIAKVAP
ncbi:hypothetical protein [Streptomyces sp. H27-D2]|uniref:hypothetical protein n=1 Tax=Streptomyces sp. H27-D2 TaxID=3046304 RepID=UPI002DBBE282|nr:hypothetical protein [Streptomyces sp. H27-D2]MEC4016561.1 hypothetical protein [Streptomyces sp. H27-D2]